MKVDHWFTRKFLKNRTKLTDQEIQEIKVRYCQKHNRVYSSEEIARLFVLGRNALHSVYSDWERAKETAAYQDDINEVILALGLIIEKYEEALKNDHLV